MGDLLSIFIPTYNRADDIDKLLHSIIIENSKSLNNIHIYISSNNSKDKDTFMKVLSWKKMYPYIFYYNNEQNIGIDGNHDMMYKYCINSKYVLEIADDDLLLYGALKEVVKLCKNEFLFAICNGVFMRGGVIDYANKIYHCNNELYLKNEEMLSAMMQGVLPDGMCPLLPFYGGIIVNMQYMRTKTTGDERKRFEGTFHQYIGCLWNELLKNNDIYAVITDKPLVAIGTDVEKKTWLNEFDDTFILKVPSFYKRLYLSGEKKIEIINLYHQKILKNINFINK